jgi:nucleoside-diphosphate-sugar epimerase
MSGLDEMQSLSDRDDDIVELEQKLEALDTFSQRTTDLAVLQAADEAGIRAYILMPPDVYGVGSGLFNTLSSQIPDLVRSAISHGAPAFVENGTGQVGHVHVRDLAALYGVLLGNILEGINVPSGWKGIYFCSTGTHSWKHVAHILGSIGENIGVFDGKHPISIGIEEATRRWTGGDIRDLKLGYCARYA